VRRRGGGGGGDVAINAAAPLRLRYAIIGWSSVK
jgi:hypothetical protein